MPKNKKDEKPVLEEKFQQLDVNAKDPKTVVLMLDSPEVAVLCKACQSLQHYMEKSEQHCIELHSLGVVPRLVKLLSSTEKVVYTCAIITLAIMIPNLSVKRLLLKLDCISLLFKMLKPDEEIYVIERATCIVAHLAEEYTFKQRLVEEKGCQLLLPLLTHTDCDIVKHSIKAVSLLTTHHAARTTIANENGFSTLLQLLDSEYAEIQELTLQTLEHCLQDGQCRSSFNNSDGLAKITEFLNKQEWDDLHVLAIEVLSLSLMDEHGMEALHSSNCLQKLLQSIKDSQIPQMKTKAAKALASASRDTVSKKILHEQEAEKTFIDLLSSQEESVCTSACEVLKGLSTLTSSRQYIGRENGVKSLVNLLQHANGNIRASAVETLSAVINETMANCNLINDAGGIEGLVSLLSDESALSRLYAAQCIIAMSPSGSLRSGLVQAGAMEGLAGCLSHTDSKVLASATQGIALLATDSSAREKFTSAESITNLLELLLSTDTDVCRNSAWALAVLAQSKTVTEAVFKTKSVETLQKLSEENPHREIREYGRLALKRLLSGSLAAKYNLTKSLSPEDVIEGSEFWDMGMGEATGFIPLEQLLSQPANMNRPVIAVSLVNKPQPPQPAVVENDEDSKAKDEVETSSTGRSKSRQTKESTKSTGKKGVKDKQTSDRQISPDEESNTGQESLAAQPGLLPPDADLWEHINSVQTNIQQSVNSVKNQAERLALYVSQAMGGPQSGDDPLQYELPMAEIQGSSNCPLVPIGAIKKGTFQHRALLYKVLADQLGIPCSLHRGQYGRHWNTVILEQDEMLVDLMFTPSKLWLVDSSEALQYKTV